MKNEVKIKFNLKKIERQIKNNIRKAKYRKEVGALERSIVCSQKEGLNYVSVVVQSKDYLKYFDEGRPAGKFPPIKKLQEWVRRNIHPQEKQVKSLAYLVGRKISLKGYKGKNIFRNIKYIYNGEINIEE